MLGLGNTLTGGVILAAAADNPVHDFTTGSTPTGWITPDLSEVSGYTMAFSWSDADENSSGDYFWLKGDAGNGRTHYPLRYETALQGDYLIQLSFHAGDITCRDWGVAVSPNNATSVEDTQWFWKWGANSTRVAVQADCPNPTIYGTSASSQIGGAHLSPSNVNTPAWYTYHMYHRPSVPSTTLILTIGQSDWELDGAQQGSTASIAETIVGEGVDYWVGVGGDWDIVAGQPWAKANAIRIAAL